MLICWQLKVLTHACGGRKTDPANHDGAAAHDHRQLRSSRPRSVACSVTYELTRIASSHSVNSVSPALHNRNIPPHRL